MCCSPAIEPAAAEEVVPTASAACHPVIRSACVCGPASFGPWSPLSFDMKYRLPKDCPP